MPERDEKGRFVRGHSLAAKGGRGRAAKLTAAELSEIGQQGLQALADERFGGDLEAAKRWFARAGVEARQRKRGRLPPVAREEGNS